MQLNAWSDISEKWFEVIWKFGLCSCGSVVAVHRCKPPVQAIVTEWWTSMVALTSLNMTQTLCCFRGVTMCYVTSSHLPSEPFCAVTATWPHCPEWLCDLGTIPLPPEQPVIPPSLLGNSLARLCQINSKGFSNSLLCSFEGKLLPQPNIHRTLTQNRDFFGGKGWLRNQRGCSRAELRHSKCTYSQR